MSIWILFTILAAFMQSWRNALQSKLGEQVDVAGVTLARFIVATPIAALYLYILYQFYPNKPPSLTTKFWLFVCSAAAMQIIATGLMVMLFKQKNFAVGVGLAKSEALAAAILGLLFFGTVLTLTGWIGVLIGAIGILLLSNKTGWRQLEMSTLLMGVGSGVAFALTSLWIREASQYTGLSFPVNAAWVLVAVLAIQTVVMTAYLGAFSRQSLKQLWQQKSLTTWVSICSCLGSIGWFSAMSLQTVPLVKTLGQIEIFFTMMIAAWWLKQPVSKKDSLGLILVAAAAVLVMWQ